MKRLLISAAVSALICTSATAADISYPEPEPAYSEAASPWAAYIEIYGGYMWQDFGDDTEDEVLLAAC